MGRAASVQLLLDLVGTAKVPSVLELAQADWALIDAMALQHRLQPLLHAQHRDNPAIPASIRADWKQAHRASALFAMALRRERDATVKLLASRGFDALVLKGGWLAWHAYPDPALRPLRDIDLLLREDEFADAYRLLLESGYVPSEADDLPLDQIIAIDKSPQPLISPGGMAFEPHLHAWFPQGRLEYFSPAPDDKGMFARARRGDDGLLYPSPEDMLGHLVIHALYGHRLDCGPLLLSDIDFHVGRHPIDWPAFWSRAERGGWASAARLVLDLVQRHRAHQNPGLADSPVAATPADVLAGAEELLLQDLETRLSAGVAASGVGALWRRATRRVSADSADGVRRDSASEGGYLAWATRRLARTLSDLTNPDVRRQSRQLSRLSQWLDTP